MIKYEAKNNGSDEAISQATSTPWVSINRDDSIAECKDIGAKYDLITNDEWQSIARNIELVGSNWKNSTVGDVGGLSTGHSDNVPSSALAASSNDNNACEYTGETCSGMRLVHPEKNSHII